MSLMIIEVQSLRRDSRSIMGRIWSTFGSGTFGMGTSHFQFQYSKVERDIQACESSLCTILRVDSGQALMSS